MSHSKDYTMLAKLGFQDKDKQDSRHDLACQYLCQPSVAKKLFSAYSDSSDEVFNAHFKAICEACLVKGQGQYRTIVGFADVLMIVGAGMYPNDYWLLCEIKIHKLPVGDILRQINLYRDMGGFGLGGVAWPLKGIPMALFVDWALSESDMKTLQDADINVYRLGDGFTRFAATSQQEPAKVESI